MVRLEIRLVGYRLTQGRSRVASFDRQTSSRIEFLLRMLNGACPIYDLWGSVYHRGSCIGWKFSDLWRFSSFRWQWKRGKGYHLAGCNCTFSARFHPSFLIPFLKRLWRPVFWKKEEENLISCFSCSTHQTGLGD